MLSDDLSKLINVGIDDLIEMNTFDCLVTISIHRRFFEFRRISGMSPRQLKLVLSQTFD
jgi:hypothetical protein